MFGGAITASAGLGLLLFRRRREANTFDNENDFENTGAGVNPLYEAESGKGVRENPMFESFYGQN